MATILMNTEEIFSHSIGYEVEGLERIPTEGPVLIVFYHGALPIDFYYLFAKIWLYRNRRVRVVADNFVFKIPGWFLFIFNHSLNEFIRLI